VLTKDTKDRIDRARQILVGQLPLPSDQIELITIALIYKFMDDMDEQSRDLGGQASFFVGKLRDYSWREIVANKLDAKERVDRFVKGVEQLSDPKDNPIPELFQSIFRNTFVKFRDGRTLKLFLDELNGFTYDHSEELGNAFEYLLETMGTQADNGQFRTPRHIIDFVVAAVAPQLGQTILDPACGTAGFLISSFRHIIAAHTSEPEKGRARRPGDRLTAEQRQQLTRDVVGYDITPQMARLSRVNMYLHQFASPVIHEYDTITNTARWDEKFDVILANPPFMSPHGGNQTHDKFRIAASRTEVLFADYILEHLLPDGRAGFIVPEGIIFQNNGDYVALRKWLIEEGGLWAVASLPAGVFQPYSGVKTSVLFIDRALARRRSDVLLLKIENDGFGLNTNRNPIAANDLPAALQLIEAARGEDYQAALAKLASPVQHRLVSRADFARLDAYRANVAAWDFCRKRHTRLTKAEAELAALRADADADPRAITRAEGALARLREEFPADTGLPSVPADATELKSEFESRIKSAAVAYGDDPKAPTTLTSGLRECLDGQREYSLTLDQHVEAVAMQSHHPLRRVDECLREFKYPPKIQTKAFNERGRYPIIDQSEKFIAGYTDDPGFLVRVERPIVAFGDHTLAFKFIDFDFCLGADGVKVLAPTDDFDPKFFYFILRSLRIESLGYSRHFKVLKEMKIPVPPLEEQWAIVAEIEGYQHVVDGCAAVLAGYRPNLIVAEEWERVPLGEIADVQLGKMLDKTKHQKGRLLPYLRNISVRWNSVETHDLPQMYFEDDEHDRFGLRAGDVLVCEGGEPGRAAVWDGSLPEMKYQKALHRVRFKVPFEPALLVFLLQTMADTDDFKARLSGATIKHLPREAFVRLPIPVPPIETQHAIVAELTREQATLAGVAELKAKYEACIRAHLAAVWGETPAAASAPTLSSAEVAA
jgi:type I restriction-modification system DNA methylase subunit/restriction endonuclease S subunit